MYNLRMVPFRGFENAARKMSQMMDELDKGVNFEIGSFKPRVDIAEDNLNIYVFAEMSGMSKEDVKISINQDNELVIKGEKKSVRSEGQTMHRTERNFGNFERIFILPDNLKTDAISAKFENGLLEIQIPKLEPPMPKEVEISII